MGDIDIVAINNAKDLMLKMAAAIEEFFYQANLRHFTLMNYGKPGWQKFYDDGMADREMRQRCHEIFAPLYRNIENATAPDKEFEELLKKLAGTQKGKPMN